MHPVLEDPSDFIALFSRVLETNVPVLAHDNNDFVWWLAIVSARCFTYQLFVILSSSFFHFLNSARSLNVLHLKIVTVMIIKVVYLITWLEKAVLETQG